MRVLAVDPDPEELKRLTECIREIHGNALVEPFGDPLMAVKYGVNNPVDAVYTVTAMRRLNGFEMMQILHSFQGEIAFHFIAGSEAEKIEALRLAADSCIFRPISAEAFRRAAEER